MGKINANEELLLNSLNETVSHYDFNYADAPGDVLPATPREALSVAKIPGNPAFKANFNVSILLRYFTVAAGVYTSRTAAYILANHAALATQLTAFMFGQSDQQGGFKNAQGQFPLSGGWAYDVTPFVYGYQLATTTFGNLDATAKAQLQVGDLVIPYQAVNAAINVVGLVIIRCQEVSYGKLLASLSSDRFYLNNIRYVLTDTSAAGLTQFNNNLFLLSESIFGKFNKDSVAPDTFKQPEQFQNGIIDVPIKKGFDKGVLLGTYVNYDSVTQKMSMFIAQVDKLAA